MITFAIIERAGHKVSTPRMNTQRQRRAAHSEAVSAGAIAAHEDITTFRGESEDDEKAVKAWESDASGQVTHYYKENNFYG